MDIKSLQQFPLAHLYAWRAPIFLGKQSDTSPEAAERREIRQRVFDETARTRGLRDADDFADLL